MSLEKIAADYYAHESDGLSVDVYYKQADNVAHKELRTYYDEEDIDNDAIEDALHEAADTLRVTEVDGHSFAICEANLDAPDEDAMLHLPTYSSAIPSNPGNAYEFAAQAIRYPDVRQVYVGMYGIGSTSPLTTEERKYTRKQGRYTWEDEGETVALPSIAKLATALANEGLTVTRMSGDSAGGNYATALGVALPEGQISHAFMSERPGLVHLGMLAMVKGMLYDENIKNSQRNREIGQKMDSQSLTDEMIEKAKEVLAEYTEDDGDIATHTVSTPDTLKSLWTSLQALRKGPRMKQGDPKAIDTNAYLRNQPEAQTTMTVAEQDPLYKNKKLAYIAAQRLLSHLSVQGEGEVRVIMLPEMTHAYNTFFPSLYHAIKRDALEL